MKISFELPLQKDHKEEVIGAKSLSEKERKEAVTDAICEGFKILPEAIENLKIENEQTIFPKKVLHHRMEERAQKIISIVEKDCRALLTKISKKTDIPLSTVFKIMEQIKKHHTFRLELIPTGKKVYGTEKTDQAITKIIECLKEDPRMALTEMSRRTGIPVSTIFDYIIRLEGAYKLKLKLESKYIEVRS